MVLTKIVKKIHLNKLKENYSTKANKVVEDLEKVDTKINEMITNAYESAKFVKDNLKFVLETLNEIGRILAGADIINARSFIMSTRGSQVKYFESPEIVKDIINELSENFGGSTGLELAAKYYQHKIGSSVDPLDEIINWKIRNLLAGLYGDLKNRFELFGDALVLDPEKLKQQLTFELVNGWVAKLELLYKDINHILDNLSTALKYNIQVDKLQELKVSLEELRKELDILEKIESEYRLLEERYGVMDSYNMLYKTVKETLLLVKILGTLREVTSKALSFKKAYEQGEIPKEIFMEYLYLDIAKLFKSLSEVVPRINDYINRIDKAKIEDPNEAINRYMESFMKLLEERLVKDLRSRVYAELLGVSGKVNSFEEFEKILKQKIAEVKELNNIIELTSKINSVSNQLQNLANEEKSEKTNVEQAQKTEKLESKKFEQQTVQQTTNPEKEKTVENEQKLTKKFQEKSNSQNQQSVTSNKNVTKKDHF
jgi:hypothetical protein